MELFQKTLNISESMNVMNEKNNSTPFLIEQNFDVWMKSTLKNDEVVKLKKKRWNNNKYKWFLQ